MEGLTNYIIFNPKNANSAYQEPFISLMELLNTEYFLWLDRSYGKTLDCIVKCRATMDITCCFIREDNFKAAMLTLMKHETFINDLKSAFRRRKVQLQQALNLYKRCLKAMKLWNEEQN
jgi:hypothetical protein